MTEASALYGGPLTYEQFKKLYPATRNFQPFDSEQRANIAASHRLGFRQRKSVGQYFYTHELCGNISFFTAKQAVTNAFQNYLCQFKEEKNDAKNI